MHPMNFFSKNFCLVLKSPLQFGTSIRLLFFLSLFLLSSCNINSPEKNWNKNNLDGKVSAHFKFHRDDPVWWQPWEKKTLAYAKETDRLILLSIGYSSCHWCQEMGRTVFQKQSFADVANSSFVSIKVDREIRPDLDQYFLKAQQAITKRVGWPVTLVLTPDLKPIFGASVVPLKEMTYILKELKKSWSEQKEKLIQRGLQVESTINKQGLSEISKNFDNAFLKSYIREFSRGFDGQFGGKRSSIKYPIFSDLKALLRDHRISGNSMSLKMVKNTLHNMLKGSVYDHIGRGLHQNAQERRWHKPNFEKTLPNQVELIDILFEMQKHQPSLFFNYFLEQMVNYVMEDFLGETNLFYSSINSESPSPENQQHYGIEGQFYTWNRSEVQNTLSKKDKKLFFDTYNLSSPIKSLQNRSTIFRKTVHIDKKTDPILDILRSERAKKFSPEIDKKAITAWNAKALSVLYRLTHQQKWQYLLPKINPVLRQLLKHHRNWKGNFHRATLGKRFLAKGIINDYVNMSEALLESYQVSGNEQHLSQGYKILKQILKKFSTREQGGFYLSDDRDSELFLSNLKIFQDSTRPSAQALLLSLLRKYSLLFDDQSFQMRADKLESSFPDFVEKFPHAFPTFVTSIQEKYVETRVLITVGTKEHCRKSLNEFSKTYFPFILFSCQLLSKRSSLPIQLGKTSRDPKLSTFFVCSKRGCLEPTTDIARAKKLLFKLGDSSL